MLPIGFFFFFFRMNIVCLFDFLFFATEIDIAFAPSDFRSVSDFMSENFTTFLFSPLCISSAAVSSVSIQTLGNATGHDWIGLEECDI